MKNQTSPVDDLKHIRQMMEESSKFLSLSGLSGIAVGCFALLGSAVAYFLILEQGTIRYDEFLRVVQGGWFNHFRLYMILDALFVLTGALVSAWYITYRQGKHKGQKFWTPSAKKLVGSLSSVLVTGGLFCIILLLQGYGKLLASSMLIFYGLALLNAAKYSKHDIRSLAYAQVVLGLLGAVLLDYGLFIWTIGFGMVHIIYGTVMYFKYDRR
ncbi:MAG: hypothetical protein QM786_11135 [Breznakibacter sp.]